MSSSSPFAEIHDELRAVARDLLGGYSPMASGEGQSQPVDWDKLAQAGWTGLEVPEQLGGAGATLAEVAVVLQEMGRAATISPYLSTAVLGAGLLRRLEPSGRRDELLGQIAAGAVRVAVAIPSGEEAVGPSGEGAVGSAVPAFTGTDGADALIVAGGVDVSLDADGADVLLLPLSDPSGGMMVAALDADTPGLDIRALPVVDETRRLAAVNASKVVVAEAGDLLRPAAAGDVVLAEMLDRGAFAMACDSLGLAESMVSATVAYVAVRQQFGRPIGSFQAVKHACADMLIQVRVGQELVAAAGEALVAGGNDAWVAVSQAKSQVCAVAVDVAGKAMQLHGGIGYTWESGIHAYLKRVALNRALFGSSARHRRRLAARYQ